MKDQSVKQETAGERQCRYDNKVRTKVKYFVRRCEIDRCEKISPRMHSFEAFQRLNLTKLVERGFVLHETNERVEECLKFTHIYMGKTYRI